jgi:tetratricopeptide (TPR) repeat protein
MTDNNYKARDDIDRCLILEPKDGEARSMLKGITSNIDASLFLKHREEANEFLKSKKFFEALEAFEKCLRVTKKATSMDNIAIYVNKIACLLALDKLERVIQESNEAIRLIRNFRMRD